MDVMSTCLEYKVRIRWVLLLSFYHLFIKISKLHETHKHEFLFFLPFTTNYTDLTLLRLLLLGLHLIFFFHFVSDFFQFISISLLELLLILFKLGNHLFFPFLKFSFSLFSFFLCLFVKWSHRLMNFIVALLRFITNNFDDIFGEYRKGSFFVL